MCRLNHLRRKFLRDEKYKTDYVRFMEDILEKGDAETVQQSDYTGVVYKGDSRPSHLQGNGANTDLVGQSLGFSLFGPM